MRPTFAEDLAERVISVLDSGGKLREFCGGLIDLSLRRLAVISL